MTSKKIRKAVEPRAGIEEEPRCLLMNPNLTTMTLGWYLPEAVPECYLLIWTWKTLNDPSLQNYHKYLSINYLTVSNSSLRPQQGDTMTETLLLTSLAQVKEGQRGICMSSSFYRPFCSLPSIIGLNLIDESSRIFSFGKLHRFLFFSWVIFFWWEMRHTAWQVPIRRQVRLYYLMIWVVGNAPSSRNTDICWVIVDLLYYFERASWVNLTVILILLE